ncbi:MAG: hypothetical protein JXA57_04915 [Armatimonadetes bacterium]|nr:hypothetical protein [Armatimonadota bacterium]
MVDEMHRRQRKLRRISYEDFRQAANANACCAGDGTDTTTTLATIVAKQIAGTKPAEALEDLLNQGDDSPVNGVWHHALVGEILLVCLRNAGHEISEDLIDEVVDRGRQIPGGACGFLGTCGALDSASSAYSILLGSTPVATEPRERLLRFSAKLVARLAEIGGSRCCKKSSYAALETAREEFAKVGFELPEEKFEGRCPFFAANETCDGEACVYFPTKR